MRFNLQVLVLLVLSLASIALLDQVGPAIAQVPVVRPPSFIEIYQQPLEPPPGYTINVTAIVSCSRPISHVVLHFRTAKRNETFAMLWVGGNSTYASYYANIPPQPVNEAVAYHLVAIDVSGFQGTSGERQFIVKKDTTPPSLELQFAPHSVISADIGPTSFSAVAIRTVISDTGTGVRDVLLRFSNSSKSSTPLDGATFYGPLPRNVSLNLITGDGYYGTWEGVIPVMANGTRVIYEVEARDFAGNPSSLRYHYDVASPPNPDANLQIVLEKLDLVTKTMTVRIVLTVNYASRAPLDRLQANVVQTSYNGIFGNMFMTLTRQSGYFYQGVLEEPFPLAPGFTENLYPFDYYYAGFEIGLWLDGLNDSNFRREFYVSGPPRLIFDQQILINKTSTDSGYTHISLLARLDRKPSLINPIMQAIYSVFFLLGMTAWLPYRRNYLQPRLTILTGLFTFVVLLYFTVSRILEELGLANIIGLAVPLVLLMALVWSIAIFLAASLMAARAVRFNRISSKAKVGKHILNIVLSFTALAITSFFSQPELVMWGQSASFDYLLPLRLVWGITSSALWNIFEVKTAVLMGLFTPACLLILFDVVQHRSLISNHFRSHSEKTPEDKSPPASGIEMSCT